MRKYSEGLSAIDRTGSIPDEARMIVVVDYEMGNVGSILNMLRRLGQSAKLSFDRSELTEADGIILPGVGAFDTGIRSLQSRGLIDTLTHTVVDRGTPMLGICLGMQLLTRGSDEGQLPGLGLIDAYTRRFAFPAPMPSLPIPHMGWNEVRPVPVVQAAESLSGQLFAGTEPDQRYYFVHSYHARCVRAADVLGTAVYGFEFAAAIGSGNVAGTQFHPEKSLRFGVHLMKNFLGFCAARAGAVA
jgi:glutamine amidotransferase